MGIGYSQLKKTTVRIAILASSVRQRNQSNQGSNGIGIENSNEVNRSRGLCLLSPPTL